MLLLTQVSQYSHSIQKLPVYMDYQATTPMDERVLEKINNVSKNHFGNAHSVHKIGKDAQQIVYEARKNIASVINANIDEIIFTSGATESNNLAIRGIVESYAKLTEKNHIITSVIEHACVKNTCEKLEQDGLIDVTYLYPNKDGIIDLEKLEKAITEKTLMISIMGVNNEIGVIQDLEKIGKIAKKHNVFFHTDCAQAFGKIPLDVKKMNIHLMSISAHKVYGPKGIGALYINNNISISPIIYGGGQEMGIRSGTLPVQLIAGFGEAAKIAKNEMDSDNKKISALSERLKEGLLKIDGAVLNGSLTKRYKGCMNFSFSGLKGVDIVNNLSEKVALSIGSACGSSHNAKNSYVIESLGSRDDLKNAVRFGIGKFTTEEDIDYTIKEVSEECIKLRSNLK